MTGGAGRLRPRLAILAIAVVGLFVGGVSCGSGSGEGLSAEEAGIGPPPREIAKLGGVPDGPIPLVAAPTSWSMLGVRGPRRIEISSDLGFCAGGGPPSYWGARVWYRGSDVFVVPFVSIRRPEGDGACAGVGIYVTGLLTLRRAVEDVRIFDATTSPPTLRWPQ